MLSAADGFLRDDGLLTLRLRTIISRLIRMAGFALRRALVIEALSRIEAGEGAPAITPPPYRGLKAMTPEPRQIRQNAFEPDNQLLPKPRFDLTQAILTTRRPAPENAPKKTVRLSPHTLLDGMDHQKLRLKIEALEQAIHDRADIY